MEHRPLGDPGLLAGPPEFDGGPAESEPTGPLGLGGADLFTGDAPLNVQNPAVQVAELQRSQLSPTSTGVCRQPGQQSDLFGLVE